MEPRSITRCGAVVVMVVMVRSAMAATLGDGTRSLYTGLPITDASRGACSLDGVSYPSETSIPRDHPCHYCICRSGTISCHWKACPSPPEGCSTMYFEGKCNPSLYKCTVPKRSMAEPVFGQRLAPLKGGRRRWGRAAREEGGQLPVQEDFPLDLTDPAVLAQLVPLPSLPRPRRAIGSAVFWQPRDKSCTILGVKYGLGEVVGVATTPCMECRCAAGDLFCSPRCCFTTAPLAPNRLQVRQHEQGLLRGQEPLPHPLSGIRHQLNAL